MELGRRPYQLKGDGVAFGQMAGTQMACLNPIETERPFRDALKSATRLTLAGDRLELFDAMGTRFLPAVQRRPARYTIILLSSGATFART